MRHNDSNHWKESVSTVRIGGSRIFLAGGSKTSSSGCVLTAYQWRPNCSYTVSNHTHFG